MTKGIKSTWEPVNTFDCELGESGVWSCPDCGWAVQLDEGTPFEHCYNFCPECGRKRIFFDEEKGE